VTDQIEVNDAREMLRGLDNRADRAGTFVRSSQDHVINPTCWGITQASKYYLLFEMTFLRDRHNLTTEKPEALDSCQATSKLPRQQGHLLHISR
jgi:hypothetical protein